MPFCFQFHITPPPPLSVTCASFHCDTHACTFSLSLSFSLRHFFHHLPQMDEEQLDSSLHIREFLIGNRRLKILILQWILWLSWGFLFVSILRFSFATKMLFINVFLRLFFYGDLLIEHFCCTSSHSNVR